MPEKDRERLCSMIWGALVADAASVGFHWLYDQDRIREIAPHAPEFRPPTPSDFENVRGYFAHGHKRVGELSQYGEQTLVLLRSLAANAGRYGKSDYEDAFRAHFGYGGAYVGYIDHPTRDTLDNIASAEHEALARAKAIPFDGDDNTQRMMITKALSYVKKTKGDELRSKVEEAVRITHDDDKMVAYALKIVAELEGIRAYHGANDEQLPAIAKLPALVACYAGIDSLYEVVESAVRVTNNNDLAVHFGHATAAIMEAALDSINAEAAVVAGCNKAAPIVTNLAHEALALRREDNSTVTATFGMSCNLIYGFPSLVHNLVTSNSYRDAIRQNIYAGGDSCGRSILLGAVLGATNGIGGDTGVPVEWIGKLAQEDEVGEMLQNVL